MACGGESARDACRAGEHAPVGTTLCPEPAQRPPVWIFTSLSWERNQKRTPQLRRSGASSCRYGQRAAALRAGLVAVGGVFAAALRWASDLDRNAVTFVALSGVFPRTSMRPPCLRKAVRSAALVSLVRLRPTSLALLGRADRCEVMLDLRGMESPCRWFTDRKRVVEGKRVEGRLRVGG